MNQLRRCAAGACGALREFRQKSCTREWLLLFFWCDLLWCETVVRFYSAQFFFTIGVVPTALFSAVAALVLYTLCSVFPRRVCRVLELTFTWALCVFYASQLIYNYEFHFFYSAYSMGNGGQVAEFWRVILHAMWVRLPGLLAILLPAVLQSVFGRVFAEPRVRQVWRRLCLLAAAVVLHIAIVLSLPLLGSAPMSPYDLYHDTNDLSKGALQLGLLTAFRLDVQRLLFGFDGGELVMPEPSDEPTEPPTQGVEEPTTGPTEPTEPAEPSETVHYSPRRYNVLDIDFDALAQGEENETVSRLHTYFGEQEPTKKNNHTGIFRGCNLIFITAEGFSPLAIDPVLTPTLYRLQTGGINFTNFYTPYWGVSTSDGEYVNLTGTIPKSGTWSFKDSADNAMPLTLAQQLKREGYSAYAFHDHSYTYYRRDKSHPNLGYDFKAVGNGLEITDQWPESDVEMIDVTTADFVENTPFHVYYMTVSGHLRYSFDENDNAIAAKNRALVEDLPYSEGVRAYLACQIELDRALELLLTRLKEAGVLRSTVIVLTADHYPYGLSLDEQSELAGHELDPHFEIYRNAFIIYKEGRRPETVDKLCCSLDILPTLSNLFGLQFDSRLYMGRDVFSDAPPLLIFSDRSWMTDEASYYTITEELTPFTDTPLTQEEIDYYNDIVADKFLVSQWVLEEDYWRTLFGDNLPPDNVFLPPGQTAEPPDDPDGTISPESSNEYE